MVRKLVQRLRLVLSNGPNRVDVSLPLPEDGKKSSVCNLMFSNYLDFRTMDKVQKPSDSECYIPSSEPDALS
jgi:hypothetical protein